MRNGVLTRFLGVCCCPLLAVCAACSEAVPEVPAEQQAGRAAYDQLGCGGCHGADGEGTRTAPSLTGLGQLWDQEGLVAFMRDPRAAAQSSPRLRAVSERYVIDMSPVRADEQTLGDLAEYLLNRP